ncbi:hypothetical protein BV898_10767 [Hypsibius exemplaris]|uniref:Uncharacterized protein n=1 Tax=Hypsibius exemplaris TaxID=2072580 RepID=A0A1W0WIJ9_HYPEX|nr:hypothetical protein BV898_10767 [Hypsibius exemplaris]
MQKPAFIFDGKMLLNHAALKAIVFEFHRVGKKIQNWLSDSRKSGQVFDCVGVSEFNVDCDLNDDCDNCWILILIAGLHSL